jgi:hypothetical protein
MTEATRIAKLWSGFHRLSEEHRDLILKISESIAHADKDSKKNLIGKKKTGKTLHM